MKYLIFIGLFVAGGAIGYWLGVRNADPVKQPSMEETERITEFVYDTIVERKTVEVPVYTNVNDTLNFEVDTLLTEEVFLDTIQEKINSKDTLKNPEEISIRRDEMIASRRIPITYLEEPEQKDSIIKEMLGIKESRPKEMNVQFWRSPIAYAGYKLSKNTLVLYGLSDQFTYTIYYKNNLHYLSNREIFYVIKETEEFLPYKEVSEAVILND